MDWVGGQQERAAHLGESVVSGDHQESETRLNGHRAGREHGRWLAAPQAKGESGVGIRGRGERRAKEKDHCWRHKRKRCPCNV